MPLPLPDNRGAFAHVVSPRHVALANFIAPGGCALAYPGAIPGHRPGHLTHVDEFIGNWDEAFVKDWLVRQGLEKPADVFKGCRTLADFLW